MTNKYLKLAKLGKNKWWRYVLSLPTILFFWIIIGSIVAVIFAAINPNLSINSITGEIEGDDIIGSYLVANIPFVFWGLGLYLAVRLIHQRKFLTLITPKEKIDYPRILEGFLTYWALLFILLIIDFTIFQGDGYELNFQPEKFFIFVPIALIFTPIQTTVEELFVRGYLMQWFGLKLNAAVTIIISSLIFGLPHLLNPEVANSNESWVVWLALYSVMGIFFGIITVKDNKLELALATHAANNLYVALFLNYPDSALPSPSIFSNTEQLDPKTSILTIIIINAIAYWIFFRKKPQTNK